MICNTYQAVKIKANGCEIKRKHPKEVKSTSKAVYITAKSLFTVPISHFGFKLRDLVKSNITAFADLHVLVIRNKSPP